MSYKVVARKNIGNFEIEVYKDLPYFQREGKPIYFVGVYSNKLYEADEYDPTNKTYYIGTTNLELQMKRFRNLHSSEQIKRLAYNMDHGSSDARKESRKRKLKARQKEVLERHRKEWEL